MSYKTDDLTGVSGDEKDLLVKTFSKFEGNTIKYGERLFILFFTKFPQHKEYFREFKTKSIDELKGNSKVMAHGLHIISAFSSILECLDKPEVLVEFLLKIGYNHGPRRVTMAHFGDMKQTILELFKEVLMDDMTEQVKEVWSKTLDLVIKTLFQGMENYNKDH